MHQSPRFARSRAGKRSILALTLAAVAVLVSTLLLSASGSTATPSSEYAAYPALQNNAPTELAFVSSHSATHTGDRPTWPLQAPEGAQSGWPLAESIRKLNTESPNMTTWIAKSLGGGVCVLLWVHEPAGDTPSIGYTCSGETEEDLHRGATTYISEVPGEPGRVFVAGVVPSTVAAIQATLANGATKTVAVNGNAWDLETEGDPQSYQTIPVGG
ncbi:MAG TPA: hypothetical protein VHS55_04370 [Solirubrobacteraceae bacterium]|jgi:hypothetical protein|nr:hypothetical protein [Solirubrobacteraceae bacterium]